MGCWVIGFPYMVTPGVPPDVAEPEYDVCVAAPPELTTQLEYMYLSRVVNAVLVLLNPKAKIPVVVFPAAEPSLDATEAAVAELFTSPEYVYFSREFVTEPRFPIANMPTVLLPVAEPLRVGSEEDVAVVLVLDAYVYLLRHVEKHMVPQKFAPPNAKMPTVLFPVAAPSTDALEAEAAEDTTSPE